MTEAKQKERKRRLPPVFTASESYETPPEVEQDAFDDFGHTNNTDELALLPDEPILSIGPDAISTKEQPPHGWKILTEDQQTGKHYFVTHDVEQPPIQAFWRKTRIMSHSRWTTQGKWSDSLTRADILNQPVYYREIE